jgi:hypothetical protein
VIRDYEGLAASLGAQGWLSGALLTSHILTRPDGAARITTYPEGDGCKYTLVVGEVDRPWHRQSYDDGSTTVKMTSRDPGEVARVLVALRLVNEQAAGAR